MKVAYSYIRWSSDKQTDGNSLARQTKSAVEYCAKNGLTLATTRYTDVGVSAWKGVNAAEGALKAFLDAVDAEVNSMATDIQTALANEARRLELKTKAAKLLGQIEGTASAVSRLSVLNSDSQRQLEAVQAELTALEAGAGPGVTADFGQKSTVTQFLENERAAAKSACVDYVKANPECTEQEAADAWDSGAIAATGQELPVQSGLAIGRLYRANLFSAHHIVNATWEDQRSWIVSTPKTAIMAA